MTATRLQASVDGMHDVPLPERVRVVGVAAIVGLVQVGVTLVAAQHQEDVRSLDVWGVALLVIGPLGLLARIRYPVLAWALAFVPTMAYQLLDYPLGPIFLALLTAFINVVMRGHRVLGWAGLAVGYVISAWIVPLVAEDGPWPDWPAVAGLAAWLMVLGAGTELARSWLEQAAERARTRAEEARRMASEERLRIARELHDVLAHNISLINVRAGVALHLVDDDPDHIAHENVRPALAAIKDASKDALGELRSVLDVLRQHDGEAAPLAPTAGLDDLDALAERARGTGLDVRIERLADTTHVSDVSDGLPAGVDLAAFRVAQEALTNVVRHAGASQATMRVRRTDHELEVRVDDDGTSTAPHATAGAGARDGLAAAARPDAPARGDAPPGDAATRRDGGGRGIAGMRERAIALGGSLEAGPRPGRGFRVRARFPLGRDT